MLGKSCVKDTYGRLGPAGVNGGGLGDGGGGIRGVVGLGSGGAFGVEPEAVGLQGRDGEGDRVVLRRVQVAGGEGECVARIRGQALLQARDLDLGRVALQGKIGGVGFAIWAVYGHDAAGLWLGRLVLLLGQDPRRQQGAEERAQKQGYTDKRASAEGKGLRLDFRLNSTHGVLLRLTATHYSLLAPLESFPFRTPAGTAGSHEPWTTLYFGAVPSIPSHVTSKLSR